MNNRFRTVVAVSLLALACSGTAYAQSSTYVPIVNNKSGKVERVANYGMQDGKVFDYVTRTTPTGGQEPDFLRNIMGGLFRFG